MSITRILILLSCGHWINGGSDLAFWVTMHRDHIDVECKRCPPPGESFVRSVLLTSTSATPPALWVEVATDG